VVFSPVRANSRASHVGLFFLNLRGHITHLTFRLDSRFVDLAYAFANPLPEPSFAASEDTESEVQEPSEEEPSAAVPGLGGQSSTSGGYHFMQESELDNAGLADSQEWVDVPESQLTGVGAGTTNVETPRGEGIAADQTNTVEQQPEVMTMVFVFSGSSFDCCSSSHHYRLLETLTGPRTRKAVSHPSQGYKPNLEHPRHHPLLIRPKIFQMRAQHKQHRRPSMVTYRPITTASCSRLAGGVVGNAGIVAPGVVEAASVAASAEISAGVLEGNVAAREEGREAVSDCSWYLV
jgi:hypothetical protein